MLQSQSVSARQNVGDKEEQIQGMTINQFLACRVATRHTTKDKKKSNICLPIKLSTKNDRQNYNF